MIKNILSIIILLIIVLPVTAQDFNNYINIKSEGKLPEEFRTLSTEKYMQDLEKISSSEKRARRKAQEQFYLESNFLLDELLLSGKVLINDPLGLYINKIANEILKDKPDLRKQLRFYVVKSGAVNAFATDNGAIFINMGLLAKMENEAQIAFVLSHEISHFIKKHSINRYVTNEEIDKSKAYKKSSLEDKLMAKSLFSQEQEQESDIEGMKLYLKTKYSPVEMQNALLFLQTADVPMKEIDVSSRDFDDQIYHWSDKYYLDTLVPRAEIDDDILYVTHPSIESRVETLVKSMEGREMETGQKFIIADEAEYNRLRKIAAFETAFIFLQNHDYPEALYLSLALQQEEPNSAYLKYIIARAFYGLLRMERRETMRSIVSKPEKTTPTMQRLHHFLRELKTRDLTALALRNSWEVHQLHPDKESELMLQDILRMYINKYGEKYEFSVEAGSQDTADVEEQREYLEVLMADFDSDADFQQILEKAKEKQETKESKGKKKNRRNADASKNILLLDPLYIKLDERKDQQLKFIASEKKQKDLTQTIAECAEKAGVNVTILSPFDLEEDNMELYSEIAVMKEYFNNLEGEENSMVPLQYAQVQSILNKYNADKVGIAGAVGVRQKKTNAALVVCFSAMLVYTLPFGIIYALSPEYDAFSFIYLYDFSANKPAFEKIHYMNFKDSDAAIKSSLYYSFLQLKKNKKK